MERLFSLLGMVVILAIAWALSTDRKAIQLRTIGWGLGLQLILALFVLKTPIGQEVFSWVGSKITRVLNLSHTCDLVEAAAKLFRHLRTFDQLGVASIAVARIPDEGLGEAINDRLGRAAAPKPR